MNDVFYIGGLELSFNKGIVTMLESYDSKFCNAVLPITACAWIDLQEVDDFCIPEGKAYMLGSRKVWSKQECEVRLYTVVEGDPFLMSVLEGEKVTIYAGREEWKKRKHEFRPWFNIHLEQLLLRNRAVVLHSASIIVNGKAIIFTAPSGTGKTTQTDLWHKYRENVEDLNGDRTLLQWTENGWYACGFPIYGSSVACEQRAVPIAGIVIIRRGKMDSVRELSVMEKVSLLYSEMTVPAIDADAVNAVMDLIEDLVQHVTVVQLNCTMERSAVDVLREYLNSKGQEV